MPTPLYHQHQPSAETSEDDKASPTRHTSVSVPITYSVPLAPPEDLLTHFGVINEHIAASNHNLHEALLNKTSDLRANQRSHRDSISSLTEAFNNVSNSISVIESGVADLNVKTKRMSDEIMALKKTQEPLEKIRTVDLVDMKELMVSVHKAVQDMVTRTDDILFQNSKLAEEVARMGKEITRVNDTQETILKYMHKKNPSFDSKNGSPNKASEHSTAQDLSLPLFENLSLHRQPSDAQDTTRQQLAQQQQQAQLQQLQQQAFWLYSQGQNVGTNNGTYWTGQGNGSATGAMDPYRMGQTQGASGVQAVQGVQGYGNYAAGRMGESPFRGQQNGQGYGQQNGQGRRRN